MTEEELAQPADAPPAEAPRRIPRWRTWVRLGVAAYCVYLLAAYFLVPRIIRGQIQEQARAQLSREARVGEVRFNPFTLTVAITGLAVADRDGAALFAVDRLTADVSLSGLFRRAFRFAEIRIEHPVVDARILADGRPSVADLMEPGPGPSAPFQPPRLIVDRLAVTEGVVQFTDASREPTYTFRFEPLNLNIEDLITIPQEGGSHTIAIGLGAGAELRWSGEQTVEPLHFSGRFEIAGLDLRPVWDYLGEGQGLEVADGRASVTLPYDISRGDDGRFRAALSGAEATIRELSVRPKDEMAEWLTVPELRVQNVNAAWPEARVSIERVRIVKPRALVRLEAGGTFNWVRAVAPATTPSQAASAPPQPRPAARPASAPPPAPSTARVLDFRLAAFAVEDAVVTFEDTSAEPIARVEIAGINASAEGISSDLAAPVPFKVSGLVQEKGAVDAAGTVTPEPLSADVTLNARAVDLVAFGPYVTRAVPGGKIGSGTAALNARLVLSGAKRTMRVTAGGAIDNMELRNLSDERLAGWGRVAVEGLTFDDPPNRARIRKVTLDRPFASILIDREGQMNLTGLTASAAPSSAAPAPAGAPASARAPVASTPGVEVVTVEIRDATAEFTDESMLLPFTARIHSAGGAIRDLSTFAAAPATIAIEGRVDTTGYVKADGTLRLADPLAASEVGVEFRSIEMVGLTPFVAEFAGYRVREGVMDLDVRYVVKDRRLVGSNRVMARDLVLGDKVDNAKAPPLPVRLAIALLKDRDGRINIDVPIEGSVDSPEWGYRKVFWDAVRTIIGNAVKAPFRMMGRLFGRDEEDLELVEFDPGRSDLLPAEQATLARMAEQIAPRQDIKLVVEGRFDPQADAAALKRAKLEALIESRREAAAAAAAAAGGSTLETILEALFTEQFSAEALLAERQRFTVAPAPAAAPVLNAAGFYESLRARLLDAQPVGQADLDALATARAASIRTALTGGGVVDVSRVAAAAPAPVSRKKAGSTRVAAEMTMSAE